MSKLYQINHKTWQITEMPRTEFRASQPGNFDTELEAKKALSIWLHGQGYAMHRRWCELQIDIADEAAEATT